MKYSNQKQKKMLVSLMEADITLANAYNKQGTGKYTLDAYREQWSKVADQLNRIGPPSRHVEGWQKIWLDMKYVAKKKITTIANTKGSRVNLKEILTPLESKITKFMDFEKLLDVPNNWTEASSSYIESRKKMTAKMAALMPTEEEILNSLLQDIEEGRSFNCQDQVPTTIKATTSKCNAEQQIQTSVSPAVLKDDSMHCEKGEQRLKVKQLPQQNDCKTKTKMVESDTEAEINIELSHVHQLQRSDLQTHCRTCLTRLSTAADAVSYDIRQSPHLTSLLNLCTTTEEETATYPQRLCAKCHDSLQKFYTFQQMALETAELFELIVREDNTALLVQDTKSVTSDSWEATDPTETTIYNVELNSVNHSITSSISSDFYGFTDVDSADSDVSYVEPVKPQDDDEQLLIESLDEEDDKMHISFENVEMTECAVVNTEETDNSDINCNMQEKRLLPTKPFQTLSEFLIYSNKIESSQKLQKQLISELIAIKCIHPNNYITNCWRRFLTDTVANQFIWCGSAPKRSMRDVYIMLIIKNAVWQKYGMDEAAFGRACQRYLQCAQYSAKNLLSNK